MTGEDIGVKKRPSWGEVAGSLYSPKSAGSLDRGGGRRGPIRE